MLFKNGSIKWRIAFILLAGLALISCKKKTDESEAIKRVLEKESATWRSGDFKAHAACWHIQPYSRILVSTPSGTYDVPPASVNDPAVAMGNGGSSVNTNYKMNISGHSAWVSHNEESIAKDGAKTYSYEIRILEKINGEWKLVGQSIHVYEPR